jgi:hypothetical protein
MLRDSWESMKRTIRPWFGVSCYSSRSQDLEALDKVLVCLCPCGFDNLRNTLRWKLLQLAYVRLQIILFGLSTTNRVHHLDPLVNQPTEPGVPLTRPAHIARSHARQQSRCGPCPARVPAPTELTPAHAITQGMAEHCSNIKRLNIVAIWNDWAMYQRGMAYHYSIQRK